MFQHYPTVMESYIPISFECVATFVFECKMRVMSVPALNRVFSYTIWNESIQDSPLYMEVHDCNNTMHSFYCTLNY